MDSKQNTSSRFYTTRHIFEFVTSRAVFCNFAELSLKQTKKNTVQNKLFLNVTKSIPSQHF